MDIDDIEWLDSFISEKGWKVFDNIYRSNLTVEASISSILNILDEDQKYVFKVILDDYLIVRNYDNYSLSLISSINGMVQGDISICPVVKLDSGEIKSAQAYVYELKGFVDHFRDRNVKFYDHPRSLVGINEGVVFVDDYIGTGTQFLTMISGLKQEGIVFNNPVVASIVIQKDGKKRISNQGYRVISIFEREKRLAELKIKCEQIYEIYDQIEKKLECATKWSKGYAQSEGVVSMKKTPNNTLPIFWHSGKGGKWPAPFPRF